MRPRILYILLLSILWQCKPKSPTWESGYLVPLIKTEVQLNQLVNDSLVKTESDNSITLVYQQNIGELSVDTLVDFPDKSFLKNTKLSTLDLNDNTFNADITLGMIAQNWPTWGPIIIGMNGTTQTLPNIYGVTSGPHPADIQDIFQSATFSQGFMDISVTNNFPCDIANLSYELNNANSGTNFVTHTFTFIAQGATETTTIALAGKTLEGSINASLLNVDLLFGNQSVYVDTSLALEIVITLRDLKIQTATAIFPAQEIVHEEITNKLDIGNTKLKSSKLETGNITIDVISTAQDTVYFTYSIPGATKNGNSFSVNTKVPPATQTSNSTAIFNYDFSGYDLDLTGQLGDQTNTVFSIFTGRIDSTGLMVTLSEFDSLYVNLRMENLQPSFISGFLGSNSFQTGEKLVDFDIYKKIVSGNMQVENISTVISVENGFGMPGKLKLNKLEAINTNSGNNMLLNGSILSNDFVVNKANNTPYITSYNSAELNSQNSNVSDILAIMPDKLIYDISFDMNAGKDSINSDYNDFAYSISKISTTVDTEIPLSLVANDLTLRDTIEMDNESDLALEGVTSGTLFLIVDNGFPLSCILNMKFYDSNFKLTKELSSSEKIEQGEVVNGKVSTETRSVIEFPILDGDIDRIVDADYTIITATFSSDNSQFVKIYSDYILGISLSGNFIYNNETK